MPGRREVYDQALRQGNSAAWDQKWEHAIAAYRRALEEFPGDATALEHLGLAYVQNGQLDLALTAYQQAATADPSNPIPQEKMSEILERKGRAPEAIRGYMAAAELYLGRHEGDKAMDDWLAAARLAPENLLARSRLALSFERTGRTLHALTEYLALAAILQKNNQRDKALQAVDQAIRLQPANQQVARARAALQAGETLAVPPPLRLRGTAPLVPPKPAPAPAPIGEPGPKPEEEPPANAFEDAQLQALAILANLTFESTREPAAARRAGLEEFDRDATADEGGSHDEVLVQLAKAIDAFARGSQQEACGALERSIRAGCDYPAAHFMLGALRLALGEPARAVPALERAVDSPELGMGAHYGLGFALGRLNQSFKAVGHYLAALRIADMRTVAAEQRDALQRQYETFFEVDEKSQDAAKWQESCERIESLMSGVDWESRLRLARAQLDFAIRWARRGAAGRHALARPAAAADRGDGSRGDGAAPRADADGHGRGHVRPRPWTVLPAAPSAYRRNPVARGNAGGGPAEAHHHRPHLRGARRETRGRAGARAHPAAQPDGHRGAPRADQAAHGAGRPARRAQPIARPRRNLFAIGRTGKSPPVLRECLAAGSRKPSGCLLADSIALPPGRSAPATAGLAIGAAVVLAAA